MQQFCIPFVYRYNILRESGNCKRITQERTKGWRDTRLSLRDAETSTRTQINTQRADGYKYTYGAGQIA